MVYTSICLPAIDVSAYSYMPIPPVFIPVLNAAWPLPIRAHLIPSLRNPQRSTGSRPASCVPFPSLRNPQHSTGRPHSKHGTNNNRATRTFRIYSKARPVPYSYWYQSRTRSSMCTSTGTVLVSAAELTSKFKFARPPACPPYSSPASPQTSKAAGGQAKRSNIKQGAVPPVACALTWRFDVS